MMWTMFWVLVFVACALYAFKDRISAWIDSKRGKVTLASVEAEAKQVASSVEQKIEVAVQRGAQEVKAKVSKPAAPATPAAQAAPATPPPTAKK